MFWLVVRFHIFKKRIRESNVFPKEVNKELISRKKFWREKIFRFSMYTRMLKRPPAAFLLAISKNFLFVGNMS